MQEYEFKELNLENVLGTSIYKMKILETLSFGLAVLSGKYFGIFKITFFSTAMQFFYVLFTCG